MHAFKCVNSCQRLYIFVLNFYLKANGNTGFCQIFKDGTSITLWNRAQELQTFNKPTAEFSMIWILYCTSVSYSMMELQIHTWKFHTLNLFIFILNIFDKFQLIILFNLLWWCWYHNENNKMYFTTCKCCCRILQTFKCQ